MRRRAKKSLHHQRQLEALERNPPPKPSVNSGATLTRWMRKQLGDQLPGILALGPRAVQGGVCKCLI